MRCEQCVCKRKAHARRPTKYPPRKLPRDGGIDLGSTLGEFRLANGTLLHNNAVVQPHIISLGFFIIFKCNELKAVFSGAIIFNFRIYFLVSFFFAFKLRSTSFSWAGISSQWIIACLYNLHWNEKAPIDALSYFDPERLAYKRKYSLLPFWNKFLHPWRQHWLAQRQSARGLPSSCMWIVWHFCTRERGQGCRLAA